MSINSPGTEPTGAAADAQADKPDIIVLANPFKRGDKVRLPAGTLFISMHPGLNGLRFSKRANTVTLHDASEAVVANSHHDPDKWEIAQPILLTTGAEYVKR